LASGDAPTASSCGSIAATPFCGLPVTVEPITVDRMPAATTSAAVSGD